MKLLLDQNLSPRLVAMLGVHFPNSAHVREFGLGSSDDLDVWRFAATGGFTIVSKDADFHQMSFAFGHPPKVVWIRIGNCTTSQIAGLLTSHADAIRQFESDPDGSFLSLA